MKDLDLRFSVRTSLKFKSFLPFIGFLAFHTQKVWPKTLNLGKNYPKQFLPKFCYFALTLKQKMLESQLRAQKIQI